MRWITIVLIVFVLSGCIRIINSSSQPQPVRSSVPVVKYQSKQHQPVNNQVHNAMPASRSTVVARPALGDVSKVGEESKLTAGAYSMNLLVQPGAGGSLFRVYIEAPKYGWLQQENKLTKGLGYQLYQQDVAGVYASFPCMGKGLSCNPLYRDGQRFATEQAGAVATMLTQLKQQIGTDIMEVVAVGDAAALMLKVAALSEVINHLHTIDGTLSPAIWARGINQPPPLSSDPLIYHRKLQHLAQTHWVPSVLDGAERMAQAYKDSFGDGSCVRIRLVNGSNSNQNWQDMWPLLVNNRFRCEGI